MTAMGMLAHEQASEWSLFPRAVEERGLSPAMLPADGPTGGYCHVGEPLSW